MSAPDGRAKVWRAALLAAHAGLGMWAVSAWIDGPFRGLPIQDGADMLRLAASAHTDLASLHGPLYPALLAVVLAVHPATAWAVGLLGVATSLSVLVGISVLCRRLACARAEPLAMSLYVLSGSALAFVSQPLAVLLGTALLLWGCTTLTAQRASEEHPPADREQTAQAASGVSPRRAALGGALLAGSVMALWPLLLPALLVLAGLLRRSLRMTAVALGAALIVGSLAAATLPAAVWPTGLGQALRLGNGGTRSGTTDLRPGPELERLRVEPLVAAWSEGASAVSADSWHVRRLGDDLAADPAGAFITLGRKLYLFWQRTEIVEGADFRHGLSGMAPERVLLLSFGLVAPLALLGLRRNRPGRPTRHGWRDGAIWLPVLGVLLVNVATLTSSTQRFPALPFLCVAAAGWLVSRPPRAEWLAAAVLGVLLNADLVDRPLIWAGAGELQEGELLLSQGAVDPAAAVLARAAQAGHDPRAAFLLGVAFDGEVGLHGDISLRPHAEAWYREALARQPLYPEAADALMRSLIAQGRPEEALAFGQSYVARDAWAGAAQLTMASMLVRLGDKQGAQEMIVTGNRALALWALAHHDIRAARRGATELLRLGARDRALEALTAP